MTLMLCPVQESSDRKSREFGGDESSLRCSIVALVSHGVPSPGMAMPRGRAGEHHLGDIISLVWHFLPKNKAGIDDP